MTTRLAKAVAILLLILAVDEQPSAYYTLNGVFVAAVFLWEVYIAFRRKNWKWLAVVTPFFVLYNPVLRVQLTKADWAPIHILAASVLVLSFIFRRERLLPRWAYDRSAEETASLPRMK
jgi:hypothetical protein